MLDDQSNILDWY